MLYDPKHDLDEIGKELWKAADYIEEHGWCRGTLKKEDGRVCIVGAINAAGRFHSECEHRLYFFLREKMLNLTFGVVSWNDKICKSKDEAVAALREAATYNNKADDVYDWAVFK